MSLQWTFIASFLYLEIFLVIFLLLPFISPTRWNRIFRSRIINSVSAYSNIYFNVFIAILVLLFFDSIREVRKYSLPLESNIDLDHHPEAEVAVHMKLFRAQRNFYIAGFALFLWFIIRRLVTLISHQAQLAAQSQAMERQALSSTQAAQQLLNDGQNKENKSKEAKIIVEELDELKEKYEKVKAQLEESQEELKSTQIDLKSVKKQAESTNREYDRLLNEHSKLQEKIEKEDSGSKKDK